MKYYSLNNRDIVVSFKEAALQGLAPDKGLYFPTEIPQLPKAFFENIGSLSKQEIGYQVIKPFVGNEINQADLRQIVKETLDFDFPLVQIEKNKYALELFHGPTLAFKDVGARFMARCFQKLARDNAKKVTVLVATSGDTGGAVAHGFYGVEGVEVVILYPKGKVSSIQEKQLTTLGKNIKAIEVNGSFDDCQAMVKRAFLDDDLKGAHLTSANSINVARWLPQMFYYFLMYRELGKIDKPLVVSVPSGNFGNICAGMLARALGLPIAHFIAATNANDTVVRYMDTALYQPTTTKVTLSNAMDVSDPSNFVRILALFGNENKALHAILDAYSFTDQQTLQAIKDIYYAKDYLVDPHGAVGYLGLKQYEEKKTEFIGVFLETAHPVKFPECIEQLLNIDIEIPKRLQEIQKGVKKAIEISDYKELKRFLLD
ncbi:threonine synthase [Myroides sp. LoEW2-1]|uniref:threonine synthase n=1 Tax=Myroides sp. LoEW2-1 TaxID=2683192 RepID=UPI00132A859B|nr:threonine synthase [Myroides sp. LoEW2-1]MVX36743.1 threonine synthase [Myroides sp. LoEW2-1]